MRDDELIIHIGADGKITVEDIENGVRAYKAVEPETFIECVRSSICTQLVSSGIMPSGTFYFAAGDGGTQKICMEFQPRKCDVVYEKTTYSDFPLPRLVFGFSLKNGRITGVGLGVTEEGMLTPKSRMLVYPFSNVSGFRLCCGANRLPDVKSLHQLTGVMHYVMSMPNNNDHYTPERTKLGLELRHLFETLKDKDTRFYYTDVLIDSKKTLQDFVNS